MTAVDRAEREVRHCEMVALKYARIVVGLTGFDLDGALPELDRMLRNVDAARRWLREERSRETRAKNAVMRKR